MADLPADSYVRFLERTSTQPGGRHPALALLELGPGQRALDVGCGLGEDSLAMAEATGSEVIGVDANPRMVDEARSRSAGRTGVTFQVAAAESLPFPDAEFDAVWIKRTLMHVPVPGLAMSEMTRVLKPGGRMVAVEPDLEFVLLDSAFVETTRKVLARHAAEYNNPRAGRQLRRLMLEAGLGDVRVVAEPTEIRDLGSAEAALRLLTLASNAAADGSITAAAVDEWAADLRAKDRRGAFSCYACLFVATARAPRAGGQSKAPRKSG